MIRLKPYLFALFLILVASCSRDDGNDTAEEEREQILGSAARDFLTDEEFTSIQLEIGYVQGFRPTETSIEELVDFLLKHCHKPEDVTITYTVVPPMSADATLSTDQVRTIESDNRTVYNNGSELGVWVFFAGNSSERDEGNSVVLGTAYSNTSCVVYQKTIQDINNTITGGSISRIESTALQHEFGHLFGLVNLGTDMVIGHQDTVTDDEGNTAPGSHCNVEGCLMYFQTVTNLFSMALGSGPIADLDELCVNDLRANGGK